MRSFVALVATGLLAPAAFGATLFSDSFNYTADQALSSPWTTANTGGETGMWVGSASNLSFPGLSSSGGAAHTTGRFTTARASLSSPISLSGGNTTQTFYLSYVVRVDSDDNWGETLSAGLTNSGAGQGDGFYAGLYKDNGGVTHFGLTAGGRASDRFTATNALGSAAVPTGSQVYFVLAKFQVDTGSEWNDVAGGLRGYMSVYTDALPTSEPSSWQLSVTANKGWPYTNPSAPLNQAILQRANMGQDATFDELRVTTTFAEAVPVPEPTAVGALLGGMSLLAIRRRAAH